MADGYAFGHEPPKNDDGSFKQVAGRFGWWIIYSDGTFKNLASGNVHDPEDIGSGSGGSYGDEDAQDAVGLNIDSTLNYDDSAPSFGVASGGVNTTQLAADAVTQAKIAAGSVGANQLIAEAVRDISGAMAGTGLTHDDANDAINQDVEISGQVQLSSGTAVVDTTISATDATFMLALGVDDPGADAKVTGRLFWDDSAGTYKIEIVEDGTSVGNPTVNYDVVRVR